MESMQEQLGRARAENEKAAAQKEYYGKVSQSEPQAAGMGACVRQASARERLLEHVHNHKETYLRKLVALQRAEEKINDMRLSEAEAVQEFLDLLAKSGI